MKIIGKVLWWDSKDKNGIIIDASGKEFYFDISVIEGRRSHNLQPNTILQFSLNTKITNIACAKNVVVPKAKSKVRLEREFEKNTQLSLEL
jgi:hypothetical protein